MARDSYNHAVNDTIKSIYDAALDWRAWPGALDSLADVVKASAAQFGRQRHDSFAADRHAAHRF
jgi:hypothetical protein